MVVVRFIPECTEGVVCGYLQRWSAIPPQLSHDRCTVEILMYHLVGTGVDSVNVTYYRNTQFVYVRGPTSAVTQLAGDTLATMDAIYEDYLSTGAVVDAPAGSEELMSRLDGRSDMQWGPLDTTQDPRPLELPADYWNFQRAVASTLLVVESNFADFPDWRDWLLQEIRDHMVASVEEPSARVRDHIGPQERVVHEQPVVDKVITTQR